VMSDRNEWRNYSPGRWRQLAHQQADRIEELETQFALAEKFGWRPDAMGREIELLTHNLRIAKANYAGAEAENERLREFLERGGIDSSAVLAGEDDGTWQDENERLRAENSELKGTISILTQLNEQKTDDRYDDWAFSEDGYMRRGKALRVENERLQARIETLEGAIRWALGESPEGMPEFPLIGEPPYYRWRTQLRLLADLPYIAATEQGESDD